MLAVHRQGIIFPGRVVECCRHHEIKLASKDQNVLTIQRVELSLRSPNGTVTAGSGSSPTTPIF
jgi:hypothetical protein